MPKDIANYIGISTEPSGNQAFSKASGIWNLHDYAYFSRKSSWPSDFSQTENYTPSASLSFFGNQDTDGQETSLLRLFDGNNTNGRKWTFSTWIKGNSRINNNTPIFSVGVGRSDQFNEEILWTGSSYRYSYQTPYSGSVNIDSSSVVSYRNNKSWNHLLVSYDSTQATSSNRVKIWYNAVDVTTGAGGVRLNRETYFGSKNLHVIGATYKPSNDYSSNSSGPKFAPMSDNMYLSEVHFIDGQVLTPTNFGTYNSNGIWIPTVYNPSNIDDPYGKSGFKLNFSDFSGLTPSRVGKDYSGNGNNWTTRKISIGTTSLVTNGSVTASPGSVSNESNVYDGDNNTTATVATNGATLTFVPDRTITAYESIRVITQDDTNVGYGFSSLRVNDYDLSPAIDFWVFPARRLQDNLRVYEYSGSFPVGINSITLQRSGNQTANLYQIEVDGVTVTRDTDWSNRSTKVFYRSNQNVDSPFLYGTDTGIGEEVYGNYNVINDFYFLNANQNLQDGLLRFRIDNGSNSAAFTNFSVSSGKWYWEFDYISGSNTTYVGIATPAANSFNDFLSVPNATNSPAPSQPTGFIGITTTTDFDKATAGFALDCDNKQLVIYKNNVGFATTSIGQGDYCPFVGENATPGTSVKLGRFNFGQTRFTYQAPSGYKCLTNANLPEPRVGIASTLFQVVVYTGTGSQQSTSTLSFKPDLVWIKSTSDTTPHAIYDSVRGPQRRVGSASSGPEIVDNNGLISFDNTGFTVGVGTTTNFNGGSFVAWCWNVGGGSTVTNTSGVITSYVKSNPSCGVGIITYVGTGATSTVGHGLTTAPSLVFIKNRVDNFTDWAVYYPNNNNGYLSLNSSNSSTNDITYWNNIAPTSSVFTVGINSEVNQSGKSYVAYAFANVPDFMKIGAYQCNNTTSDAFVHTGFRPKYILFKNENTAADWVVLDTVRDPVGIGSQRYRTISLNRNDTTNQPDITIRDNGFGIEATGNTSISDSSRMIYIAIADVPFKYAY